MLPATPAVPALAMVLKPAGLAARRRYRDQQSGEPDKS